MAERFAYKNTRTLVGDEHGIGHALRRSQESYLSWSQFQEMPTPPALTVRESWELLQTINHATGVDLPLSGLSDERYWYHPTREMVEHLAIIRASCVPGSRLFNTLADSRNAEVTVEYQVDEVVSAAALDGIKISDKARSSVPHMVRAPRGGVERLLYNELAVVRDLPHLVQSPFTPDLFLALRDRLLTNVDERTLASIDARSGLLPRAYDRAPSDAMAARQREQIAQFLNEQVAHRTIDPAVTALLLPEIFRAHTPLPSLNDQVGRLLLRLFAIKAGIPVLGMFPISRAKLLWERGELHREIAPLREDSLDPHHDNGVDLTGVLTILLKLSMEALGTMSTALGRIAARDEELRTLVQYDHDLNHRQRSILGRALRNPEAEFRIAYHKQTHNVVYATARADLLELVERGYLLQESRGRTFVFTPRPNLHEYIENVGGRDTEEGAAIDPFEMLRFD